MNIPRTAAERGVYFIAEIGQNHQGSLDMAKEMVDQLVGTGVAAIKTAKRDIDVCLTEAQKGMPYLNPNSFGDTYYEHRKALELSEADFAELKDYVEQRGLDFISSFTDLPSLEFLLELGIPYLKIASQRLTDERILSRVAETGMPVIVSTGMSEIADVDHAVEVLAGNPVYLLQCTSTYPCPESELDLLVLETFAERYRGRIEGVGFSGHHAGIAPDLAAFVFGAVILERHFTLDRSLKGSDHSASLEKRGVELILKYIRQIKLAMGSPDKTLHASEHFAMDRARRDLHADG